MNRTNIEIIVDYVVGSYLVRNNNNINNISSKNNSKLNIIYGLLNDFNKVNLSYNLVLLILNSYIRKSFK